MRGERLASSGVITFLCVVIYFVLMLVLPINSENYQVWPIEAIHDSKTYGSLSSEPVKKENSDTAHHTTDKAHNSQSVNKKKDDLFDSKGSFYYASSSNARQEDTSVHVFVKNNLNYKNKESLADKKRTVSKVSTKSCKFNCDDKSTTSTELEPKDFPRIMTDVLEPADSSVSSIHSNDSFYLNDQTTENLDETDQKEFPIMSSKELISDDVRSNMSDKVSPNTGGSDLEEDDFQVPSLLFARSLSYSDRPLQNKEQTQRSYSKPEGIMGRRASSNGNPDNIVRSDDLQKRSGPVSRLPRLPEINPPEDTPSNVGGINIRSPVDTPPVHSDQDGDITDEELKKYIAQMRVSRAGSVLFSGNDATQEQCKTASNRTGICIPLTECREARKNIRRQTPVVCRWAGDLPVVCCSPPNLYRKSESNSFPSNCGIRPVKGLSRTVRQAPRSIPELSLRLNRPNPRPSIAGGDESSVGAWPWMAGIYTRNFGIEIFLCGAAIINKKYLVTAAHCFRTRGGANVPAARYAVRVGSIRIKEGTQHLIDSIIVHPEYQPREYYNDIALIRLKDPINLESNIRAICLPTSPEFRRRKLMGTNVTVTGWGDQDFGGKQASILREVTVRVIDLPTCDKAYAELRGTTVPRGITKEFICAGVPEGGKDACQRDSGGPLMLLENGVWTLVGVVSFGFQCAQEGYPGVYTRVTNYMNWVQEVASI